ncbi:MAG: hypothetical protein GY801_24565 [bacterium]|nr:hypothetical protein [bacterium]
MAPIQRSKLCHSLHTWKTKAIRRGKLLKQANTRVRELTQSRDQWKHKAQTRQTMLTTARSEVRRLRHRLDTAKKKSTDTPVDMPTVFRPSRR